MTARMRTIVWRVGYGLAFAVGFVAWVAAGEACDDEDVPC